MIRSTSPADRTAVAAVLADAFTDHELFVWALPDATTRRDVLAAYFSVEMLNGEVRVHEQDGEILGVAVWLDGSEPSLPQRAWLPVARAALRLLGPYSIARALYRGWRADRSVHRARPDTHPRSSAGSPCPRTPRVEASAVPWSTTGSSTSRATPISNARPP